MIEVAVAIGVMAILAGAMAPLAMKALNQAREQKTRENAQTAYEAIVGSRSKPGSNMRSDFGFLPVGTLADLRFMTIRNPAAVYRNGVVPLLYGAVYQGFTWGWNGPYWTGSIGPNREPLDGWGRPFQWAANQVQSRGKDGAWSTADDIVFPSPASAPASATLYVNVERQLPPPPPTPASVVLFVNVYDRNLNAARPFPTSPQLTFPGSGTQSFGTYAVVPGPVTIRLQSNPASANYAQSQVMILSPGESRTITFRLNN